MTLGMVVFYISATVGKSIGRITGICWSSIGFHQFSGDAEEERC